MLVLDLLQVLNLRIVVHRQLLPLLATLLLVILFRSLRLVLLFLLWSDHWPDCLLRNDRNYLCLWLSRCYLFDLLHLLWVGLLFVISRWSIIGGGLQDSRLRCSRCRSRSLLLNIGLCDWRWT